MNSKKNNNVVIYTMLIVMILLSLMMVLNSVNNVAYAEETSTYAIVDGRGQGGKGTVDDPYWETPWNGSIKSEDHVFNITSGGIYLELTVDPRDRIKDDVVINFKVKQKYIITTNYSNATVKAYVEFYNDSGLLNHVLSDPVKDKSSGRIKVDSGTGNVNVVKVRVDIVVKGDTKSIYFSFSG